MAYTIPNQSAATYPAQAQVSQADIDILSAADTGTGVVSGCAVTVVSGLQVNVATGVYSSNGIPAPLTSTNVTLTTADATNPRIDLIKATSAGVVAKVDGTAGANPVCPALPAGNIGLAMIYVPATTTTLLSNMITDKRVLMPRKPSEVRISMLSNFR